MKKSLEDVRTVVQTWTAGLDGTHACLDKSEQVLHQATTLHHSAKTSGNAVYLLEVARVVLAEDEVPPEAWLLKVTEPQIGMAASFLWVITSQMRLQDSDGCSDASCLAGSGRYSHGHLCCVSRLRGWVGQCRDALVP